MADYTYKLDMAGLLWEIVSPVELELTETCRPFLTDAAGADCAIRYRLGKPEERGELIHDGSPKAWREGDTLRVERTPAAAFSPCACIYQKKDDPLHLDGLIYPDRIKSIRTLDNLLDASELELLLSALDAFQLHSSLVRRPQGDAVLFTAPSGTGKSTQAALWEQYAGGDTLNGDRSILRRTDGVWTAFGSPFAGTSGIYRRESAPVRALVVLRQAKDNTVRRLSAPEAFRAVYSESVLPRWNHDAHRHVIELITSIVSETPVYLLACTPDERPVRLLCDTLEGETV